MAADLLPRKKYHGVTPALFFISFLLFLLVLLSSERTLQVLLSPSLYRDLFSQTNPLSPFSFPISRSAQPVISPVSETTDHDGSKFDHSVSPQVPISEGKLGDPILNGIKLENDTNNVYVEKNDLSHVNSELNGREVDKRSSNMYVGKNDLGHVNSEFSGREVENGSGNVYVEKKDLDHVNSQFNGKKVENSSSNVYVEKNGLGHVSSESNGKKVGNGSSNVYVGINDLGFVTGSAPFKRRDDKVGKGFLEGVRQGKVCNLYMGKWIRDEGYPLYEPGSCPFVDEAFDCQSNGRPDSDYLRWRWEPDECHLPRFNATDFLVRLRGKRLLLVGDSMNRNQFESMLCLLREGLPDKSKMHEVHGYKITKGRGFYIFKFVDYNCTVEFVRSHFLVKEGVRINGQGNSNPTLSIDKIDKTAQRWKKTDILVFNTGHWWTHGKTSRGKNYFKEGDHIYPQFDAVEAYRRALKTWAEWIDNNMNPARQLVFYRAYSSAHFRGGDWDSGGTCNGEKEPILGGSFLDNYPLKMKIVEEVIQKMKVPVILLNVTRLTNFRKDGHPSIYGKIGTNGKRVSTRKQDCSHWCLPGVPDAWNELIYATLIFRQAGILEAH